jgi:hypothetical protein
MDLSLVQIGFLVIMGVACLGMSLWLYIDSLKFKLRNMQFDRDMYQRLYEIQKDYQESVKKYQK